MSAEVTAKWLTWLADINYGVDFVCSPPPPCTPAELAEVCAARDGEDSGDWTEILLDGNSSGGWYGAAPCTARHDVTDDGVTAGWFCTLTEAHDEHADSVGRRWTA